MTRTEEEKKEAATQIMKALLNCQPETVTQIFKEWGDGRRKEANN